MLPHNIIIHDRRIYILLEIVIRCKNLYHILFNMIIPIHLYLVVRVTIYVHIIYNSISPRSSEWKTTLLDKIIVWNLVIKVACNII